MKFHCEESLFSLLEKTFEAVGNAAPETVRDPAGPQREPRRSKIMTRNMFRMALFGAAALAMTVAGCTQHAEADSKPQADIVETAQATGQFNTLLAAAAAADLVDTLKGPGPLTVFAPTDEAFAKLAPGTVESLLKPENKATLAAILTYHVVPGNVMSGEVVTSSTLPTANGAALTVSVSGSDVMINNAKVTAVDISASNGVVHVIDTVVLPPAN
jgi:uncharacterized surface protein with fasciclin (FAS1) repeats